MSITRKHFLKSSSLIVGGMLLGSEKILAKLLQDDAGKFKQLRDNLGIFIGKGGTIFWHITDDSAIVIDTQNPDSAKNFMSSFKEKTSRKIDYLFNTHHHGDHTAGNLYLRDFTDKIVAQENCPMLQKKAYGEGDKGKDQVYADTTFKDNWKKDLGKETVTASYFGTAHTGGDSIIYLEKANMAHAGDLVFNRVYPFIDQNGGGSIKTWIETLEKAEKNYSADTTFIFGHADSDENIIGKKQDLTNMRNYLTALLEYVSKEMKAGKNADDIKKAVEVPGIKDRKERRAGALAGNLDAAYNELVKS